MQSQAYGFKKENDIRTICFGLESENNNTNKHDIPCNINKLNNNENISIKTTGGTSIDCGDISRFFNYDFSKDSNNTILIIIYEQKEKTRILKNIIEINYNKKLHDLLFGSISEEQIQDYIKNVKKIPIKVNGDKAKKIFDYLNEKNIIQKKYKMKIGIRPKVDSSQSRVQCSIPKFLEICKDFIIYDSLKETGKPNMCRGVEIPLEDDFGRRNRNGPSVKNLKEIFKNNKELSSQYKYKYNKMKRAELVKILNESNLMPK